MIGMEKFVFDDVDVHKNIYYSPSFFKKYEKIAGSIIHSQTFRFIFIPII